MQILPVYVSAGSDLCYNKNKLFNGSRSTDDIKEKKTKADPGKGNSINVDDTESRSEQFSHEFTGQFFTYPIPEMVAEEPWDLQPECKLG